MSIYYVSSGQIWTELNSYNSMYVYESGTADSTTVNGGGLWVTSGGTANGATIKSGGFLAVSGGGTAVDLNVNASGYVYVLGDGAAASRAKVKLGLRNIAYNMDRFCFLMRQTA